MISVFPLSINYLIWQFVKVAVPCPLMLAVSTLSKRPSNIRQLLLAVTQVTNVNDRHFIERQHGPLFHPAQNDSIQLSVVVQQGAVHLQSQQVGGEVDVLDVWGKLTSVRC